MQAKSSSIIIKKITYNFAEVAAKDGRKIISLQVFLVPYRRNFLDTHSNIIFLVLYVIQK